MPISVDEVTTAACSASESPAEVERCRSDGTQAAHLGRMTDSTCVPEPQLLSSAGVDTGTSLRLDGQGLPGAKGGQPGNLLVDIRVLPHPVFQREGADIHVEKVVSFVDAILGADLKCAGAPRVEFSKMFSEVVVKTKIRIGNQVFFE